MKHLLLAMALLFVVSAQAQTSGDITVRSIWARATPPGAETAAVYLTLANHGKAEDKLVAVSTPVAGMAGLHTEIMDNRVMKMRPLKSVDVKPGGTATLKPGGRHIMLMELKQPLKQGDHFPMTLTFEHAPPLTVQVEVAKIGAAHGGGDDMSHMKGM